DTKWMLFAVELHPAREHDLAALRRAARQLDALGGEEDLGVALALEHLRVERGIAARDAGVGAARVDRDAAVRAPGHRVEVQVASLQAQRPLDAVQRRPELEADLRLLRDEFELAALAETRARRREARRQRQRGGDGAGGRRAQRQSSSRSGMKSQSSR